MKRATWGLGLVAVALVSLGLLYLLRAGAKGASPTTTNSAAARGGPSPDGETLITPQREDFPKELRERKHMRLPSKRQERLRPLESRTRLVRALGGGWRPGPSGTGDTPSAHWMALARYVIYATPADARANAFGEDAERAAMPGPHSFSGAKIGDLCGHISDASMNMFELHFVRHNVSVTLRASVSGSAGTDPELVASARKALQPEIESTLEATARVIITRIDAVVKAKGKVEMNNLPPIAPRKGSLKANPNRPPGAKPK
jgi:hypothetical protein